MFNIPNIVGRQYRPGRQPNSPGDSQIDAGLFHFRSIPWPNAVQTLSTLASIPGIPRAQALQINNNSTAVLPSNYLFISGFVGKSRG